VSSIAEKHRGETPQQSPATSVVKVVDESQEPLMPRTSTQRSRGAVATGGGSETGEATFQHLAERGCRVAVVDRDAGAAERVAKDLHAKGGEAIGIAADVTDRAAIDPHSRTHAANPTRRRSS
jgi:glutamyl-tRNA reductase